MYIHDIAGHCQCLYAEVGIENIGQFNKQE